MEKRKKQCYTCYNDLAASQLFNHQLPLPVWSKKSIISIVAKSEMSLDKLATFNPSNYIMLYTHSD